MARRGTFAIAISLLLHGCADDAPSPRRGSSGPDRDPARPADATSPERQGVSSARLRTLLEDLVARDLDVHGLAIARRGAPILEARFFPWDGRRPHDVASVTKALTATAVGIALREGAIESLDAPVTSFFPEHAAPHADGVSLRHALTMTTGFDCVAEPTEETLFAMQRAPDWIGFALDVPLASPPGTTWRYCSTATHLLSGVMTRATNEPLDAYLADRLFTRIGASPPAWPRDPQGFSHGWGDAKMTLAAMLRVGQVWLEHGASGGEPVVDAAFVDDATRNQVGDLGPPGGFGYSLWLGDGSFYADGRGGQNILVVPAYDLVVATTGAQSPAQHGALLARLAEELAAITDEPLPRDDAARAALDAAKTAIAAPPPARAIPAPPATEAEITGRDHRLEANVLGWESVRLDFEADRAVMRFAIDGDVTTVDVALDGVPRVTRGVRFAGLPRYADVDVALDGRWLDDDTFEVTFDTIDTIDAGSLRFAFGEGFTLTLHEKTFIGADIPIEGDEQAR